MSGHKWPGAPWPCGIYMTKVKYQISPPSQPEYIGAPDTTFAGSRNGFSPLISSGTTSPGTPTRPGRPDPPGPELAAYLERQLHLLEQEKASSCGRPHPGARSRCGSASQPELVAKWSLSSQEVLLVRRRAHPAQLRARLPDSPRSDRAKLDELLADLAEDHALLARA
ncbi:hypothetical protein ACFSUJ_34900 [Streptomyces lusitanus]|uniref:hypothetical protein n=1 Tax=Streptomyces lusitanus TaxID=68232 RepID=UPI00363481E0